MRFKLLLLFLFVTFFICLYHLGTRIPDSDFGWQLKNGQTFLTSGIFYKDPYSYTMPSFPVVSHEWGSDILITSIYKLGQFTGLSLIFTLIFFLPTLLLSLFSLKEIRNKNYFKSTLFWNLSVFFFSIGIFFNYFYIRPQIFSWIFWELFVLLLINRDWFNRYKYFLPILFTIWANLHGGFAIGIFFVFFIAIYTSLSNWRIEWKNFLVAALCFLATLINPFGIVLWREVLSTFFSSNVRVYIQEWQSLFYFGFSFIDFLLFFIVSLSTVLILYFRKKINFELIFVYFILIALGVSSIKNIPFWIIFNLALFPRLIFLLYKKISSNKISLDRFKKIGLIIFISSVLLSFFMYYLYISTVKYTFDYYPESGVLYLNRNVPTGQIFSQYGWGGYLIWKLPQKKVFIDGRMGVWNWNANIPNETNNAFNIYNDILREKVNFNDVAKKYNIDTVLWPKESNIRSKSLGHNLDVMTCKYIWLPNCKDLNIRPFSEILKDDGWKEVYSDKVAVIYKRNLP